MTPREGRLRVLIADDHPAIVRAVSRLMSLDYEVVGSVAHGGRLVEAVQRLQPNVIVLDVNLVDGDGLKWCREITRSNPEVKVIVFTVEDDPELRKRAFEAGASAFVPKIAVDDDLLSALRRLDDHRD